jgi:hypothetical protein
MSVNDLPAIMGTVLIVAGLVLVGIYTRRIPLGAVDIRVTWKIGLGPRAIQIGKADRRCRVYWAL